jgi:hypothetical protein
LPLQIEEPLSITWRIDQPIVQCPVHSTDQEEGKIAMSASDTPDATASSGSDATASDDFILPPQGAQFLLGSQPSSGSTAVSEPSHVESELPEAR